MASKAAIQGDPRRPQEVKKMGAVVLPAADDLVSHTLLIGALSAGVAGLMFQSRIMIWAALFLSMAAYTHMPYDAPNAPQLSVMVLTLVGWAAVQVYFKPFLMARPAQSTPTSNTIEDKQL